MNKLKQTLGKIKQWILYGVIYRLLTFILMSILYIICLPYIGGLVIVGLIFFILKEDFVTESKLDAFRDWFNKIAVYISGKQLI